MLHISAISPFASIATSLAAELSHELAERYNYADAGAGNFSPEDVTVPHAVFIVAWFGERAVGCGAIRPVNDNTAEVKRMYVAPAFRRRGIGREILRELERYARAYGFTHLCLETGDRQPEAIALYTQAGFFAIPPYPPYADAAHSRCFGKALAAMATSRDPRAIAV